MHLQFQQRPLYPIKNLLQPIATYLGSTLDLNALDLLGRFVPLPGLQERMYPSDDYR